MLLTKSDYHTIFLFILASGLLQSKYLANKNYNVLYAIFLVVVVLTTGHWLFQIIWKGLDLPQESETKPEYISYIIDFIVYSALLYQTIY